MKNLIILILGLVFISCNIVATEDYNGPESIEAPQTYSYQSSENNSVEIQVTGINFLKGNIEKCATKNQVIEIGNHEEVFEKVICENSKVILKLISSNGEIKILALDKSTGEKLVTSPYSDSSHLRLDEIDSQVEVSFINPHGMTSLTLEDVTGVDKGLLLEVNKKTERLSLSNLKL
jgi:hypothetical protein